MKRKLAQGLLPVLILFLIAAHTGCYSPAYYPSYDPGYGTAMPYQGGYPVPTFGQAYPDSYGQPSLYGQNGGGQGYGEEEDDDDDNDNRRQDDQNRFWPAEPYGNYYGQ